MGTACCPRSMRVTPDMVCADGEEVTFEKAQPKIEKTRPPASYKMENNREFATLIRFLRKDFAEACGIPSQSVSPPDAMASGPPSQSVSSPDATADVPTSERQISPNASDAVPEEP